MAQTQVRLPDVLMERITTASKKASMSKNDIIKLALEAGLKWLAEKDYDLTKSTETELLVEELKAILATHTADLERAKKVTYDRLAGAHDPSLNEPAAKPPKGPKSKPAA